MRRRENMDVNRAIRTAVDTGKVILGSKRTMKFIKHGEGKLVVIAGNIPKDIEEDVKYYAKLSNIPVYQHKITSLELGAVCGKPFPVAALLVLDEGLSNIMELVENKEGGE
ncbi:50S ribosomal protein L30e [Methanocaldococcus fervens]|uniref:Large ribosomal subunit protein eL30 n=1 Tax=Methanocaldococcus fervens (strain DSM 4213 / JCM 15782 / AG86) TaxID=573064 RepID=C7P943_METFA|nr:50S ribosomal protein L30e [Methanocaldococcus fervens]ACV25075.1 ribosomal protein L7Ae/L30e/S12e/Gadd45 [Methanocaldococcus fervens AG86]